MIKASLLAAAALLATAGTADAASFVFLSTGNGTVASGYSLVEDFNGAAPLTGTNYSLYTGNYGDGAVPAGSDGSQYLAVKAGGSATYDFASAVSGFSLYVGSVDAGNQIVFNYADGSSDSLFGSDLVVDANGNQSSSQTNGLFTFAGTGGKLISGVTFASSVNSFEVDNIATAGAVPEPTTWAMLVVGFGLVGGSVRRRSPARVSYAV